MEADAARSASSIIQVMSKRADQRANPAGRGASSQQARQLTAQSAPLGGGQARAQAASHPTNLLTLRLEAMTYGGDALGRMDGKVIFVRGGIAGEVVRAEIVEERGHFARAQVVEVVEPSPDRIQPRCSYFGFAANACGGCHWQHIDYSAQLRFKAEIVREQLQRIGRMESGSVRETISSPDVWAYRNHAQFSVTPEGRLGFQAARSNRVVPISECHIVQPEIAEWLRGRQVGSVDKRIEVRADSYGGVGVWGANFQPPTSTFHILHSTFRVSHDSFFQVNTSLIETLVELALRGLSLQGGETVLDAYCGVGLFTRFIAPGAQRVIGIESSPSAVADARINLAEFAHIELHEGLVEKVLPKIEGAIDAAIVDPPRAGCGPQVIEALIDKRVKRLVYVSCDPATLARDARQLLGSGYSLIEVQPVDIFPHTYHIESVSLFNR